MIEYSYTAFGVPKITVNQSLVCEKLQLANEMKDYNIFLYKRYCDDRETQLFYCNSRYYSPELCRFISQDDVEYLDP